MYAKKLLSVAILAAMSMGASAATFHFTGNLTYNTDVVQVPFYLAADATNVRVWTDSFQANTTNPQGTNFDPITALWNASTGALIDQDDDNDTINPATQTYYDSGFSLATLAAGNYLFTIAAYANFAPGPNIADGFGYDGQTPILISDWSQPANSNNARGTFWSVWLDGVTGATDPNQVPEPASLALVGLGLLGLALGRGRKQKTIA